MAIPAFLQRFLKRPDSPAETEEGKKPAVNAIQAGGAEVRAGKTDREVAAEIARVRARVSSEFPLPDENWMRQSGPFVSVEHFLNSSFQNFGELLRFTGIHPGSRVLDYGCGHGRIAIPLSAFLNAPHGRYRGVDTDGACIGRNQEVFADYANFSFEHVNLFSTMYNKDGSKFETLAGKDFGGPFDLAFLFSVFTHILPEDCDLLLETLCAQLTPDGELFSSWFLLNEDTERAIKAGETSRKFSVEYGAARIDHPKVPEGAVAYYEADVLDRFARAGLVDVRIIYGDWRGKQGNKVWQDIIVAKVSRPASS